MFKNTNDYPVPFALGDDVVMVPPGGEVNGDAVRAEYPVPAPQVTTATDTTDAFNVAAFRAETGIPPLPEVQQSTDDPEPLDPVEPQEVKGAEVIAPAAKKERRK